MFSLCFWLFVALVISRFGFEGWIWVLIASVPGLCILFTFIILLFLFVSFPRGACDRLFYLVMTLPGHPVELLESYGDN